jgi:hypothetical protein
MVVLLLVRDLGRFGEIWGLIVKKSDPLRSFDPSRTVISYYYSCGFSRAADRLLAFKMFSSERKWLELRFVKPL